MRLQTRDRQNTVHEKFNLVMAMLGQALLFLITVQYKSIPSHNRHSDWDIKLDVWWLGLYRDRHGREGPLALWASQGVSSGWLSSHATVLCSSSVHSLLSCGPGNQGGGHTVQPKLLSETLPHRLHGLEFIVHGERGIIPLSQFWLQY
jgi:hypothetical protein